MLVCSAGSACGSPERQIPVGFDSWRSETAAGPLCSLLSSLQSTEDGFTEGKSLLGLDSMRDALVGSGITEPWNS